MGKMNRSGRQMSVCCLLVACMPGWAWAQQSTTKPAGKKVNPPAVKSARKAVRPEYVPRVHETDFDVRPVTVVQLEEALQENLERRDAVVARELAGMQLTERMGSRKLAAWEARLRGRKTRQALVALADASAFLNLPAAEIPTRETPDMATARHILTLAVEYLSALSPKLPNFLATRTTTRYTDMGKVRGPEGPMKIGGQPWHVAETFRETVRYNHGEETVEPEDGRRRDPKKEDEEVLAVSGTFGPILSSVMLDAVHGRLFWRRWENGTAGPVAVFGYMVPKKESHFQISYRGYTARGDVAILKQTTAYQGEMTIDPADGTILRLTLRANPEQGLPIERSDILVEYGPVELGGKTYFCPVRNVAISTGKELLPFEEAREGAAGPVVTMMNDTVFSEYHLFRGDLRIVTGDLPAEVKKK